MEQNFQTQGDNRRNESIGSKINLNIIASLLSIVTTIVVVGFTYGSLTNEVSSQSDDLKELRGDVKNFYKELSNVKVNAATIEGKITAIDNQVKELQHGQGRLEKSQSEILAEIRSLRKD